jgi:hypothetical protein
MSEILSRAVFETCLADQTEAPWEEEVRMILAHDAALRLALDTATSRANEMEDACTALVRERDEARYEAEQHRGVGIACEQRAERAERERDEARAELEKSRRTLLLSYTDLLFCTQNLSVPADVKGDTLHDVVLSLLQDRADARAERDALLSRPAPPAPRPPPTTGATSRPTTWATTPTRTPPPSAGRRPSGERRRPRLLAQ